MHYIVVDLGTTHLKLAIFKPGQRYIETMEQRINLFTDRDGAREQQPEEMLDYLIVMLKRALMKYPDARKVVFSTQMHSLLLTDASGEVIQPSMIWADQRAQMQAEYFHDSEYGQELYNISGTPVHAMSPLLKLLYLRLAKPILFLQYGQVYAMGVKSYLIWQLTGKRVIDYGTASTTGLMDIRTKDWSEELLDLVRLDVEQLPALVAAQAEYGINEDVAKDLRLPTDMSFVMGSTDGALANLGLPITDENGVVFSFGTSGALRYTSDSLKLSKNGELFCYIIDDMPQYIIGGPLNNAGNVLEWAYEQYGFVDSMNFSKMLRTALHQEVREEGVIFLPYLNGERAPFWNSHMRASFHNIQLSDNRLDLVQAIIEGVFFQARLVLDELTTTIGAQPILYVNGKIFQDPEQLQQIANMLNTTLYLHDSEDASLIGAAKILENTVGVKPSKQFYLSAENALMKAVPEAHKANLYSHKFASFKKIAESHYQQVLLEQKESAESLMDNENSLIKGTEI